MLAPHRDDDPAQSASHPLREQHVQTTNPPAQRHIDMACKSFDGIAGDAAREGPGEEGAGRASGRSRAPGRAGRDRARRAAPDAAQLGYGARRAAFEATMLLDYAEGGRVLVPAGSLVRGFVSSVRAAAGIDRRGSLTLSFDEIEIGPRMYRLRASVTKALDGKAGKDLQRIGAGAVVGAILAGSSAAARTRSSACSSAAAAPSPRPRARTSICPSARFSGSASISRSSLQARTRRTRRQTSGFTLLT